MNDLKFATKIEETLNHIADRIEEQDVNYEVDIDFDGDILNLETKHGMYVINKQSAAKELWLSSPISGPKHFAYDNEALKWITKDRIDLYDILSKELKVKL
jgi:CyaY protein